MGRFAVVRERSSRSLEKVGRFRVEGRMVMVYLDGIGSFQVGRAQVIPVLLRFGDEVIRDHDDEPFREWERSEDGDQWEVVCYSGPEGEAGAGGEGEEGGVFGVG